MEPAGTLAVPVHMILVLCPSTTLGSNGVIVSCSRNGVGYLGLTFTTVVTSTLPAMFVAIHL